MCIRYVNQLNARGLKGETLKVKVLHILRLLDSYVTSHNRMNIQTPLIIGG